uniref:Uncharacterized protein n=1 Tax=Chaetoceros debilis TaxID=122233 RepID=A0A7S3QFX6_9STRA
MRCYLSNPPLLVKASVSLALILSSMSILASSAEAAIARPFPTSTNTPMSSNRNPIRQNSKALNVRGGGGWNMNPLDGVGVNFNAAKGALPKLLPKLGLVASSAMALSTSTVLDKYIPGIDLETVDPMSLLVARRIGVTLLHYSIIAYFLQCHDDATWCSVPKAVGLGALPIIVELAKGLFDGTIRKEFGVSWELQALYIFAFIAFSYSFLNVNESFVNEASFVPIMEMEMLLKMYSAFLILNGVFLGCFTKLACTFWGNTDIDTDTNIDTTDTTGLSSTSALPTFGSIWGFSLISVGTLVGCLTSTIDNNNMTTTKALALGMAPFLGKLIVNKLIN